MGDPALILPGDRAGPPPNTMCDMVRAWAVRADWQRIRHVVWVGSPISQPWSVLRDFRPDVHVVVYDHGAPRPSEAPPEGVQICSHPVELHAAISSSFRSRDRIELIGEPALQPRMEGVRAIVDSAVDYAMAQEVTTRQRSARWIDIGLDLLPLMAERPPVQWLPATWTGPAVIVGGGPSLADDMDTLGALRDRALILAASSTAGQLAVGGVQPHGWLMAEEREAAIVDMIERGNSTGSWLIPGVHAARAFWQLPSLGTLPLVQISAGIGTILAKRCKIPPLQTGSSVTTLAYAVARHLGANPIILVGQDCGYRDDCEMYAPGRCEEQMRTARETAQAARELRTPAWGGMGSVRTTPTLTIFRQWFEARAHETGAPRLVNASRRGARISGTLEVRLEDMDLDRPAQSPDEAMATAVADARRLDTQDLIDALRHELDEIDPYCAAAAAARDTAASLIQHMDQVHACGRRAGLAASYAIPSVEAFQHAAPRFGVEALQEITGKISDVLPDLKAKIEATITRLEARP